MRRSRLLLTATPWYGCTMLLVLILILPLASPFSVSQRLQQSAFTTPHARHHHRNIGSSPLFRRNASSESSSNNSSDDNIPTKERRSKRKALYASTKGLMSKLRNRSWKRSASAPDAAPTTRKRRLVSRIALAVCFWLGAASIRTAPSQAASTTASPTIQDAEQQRIIDQYIQEHIFDDDAYDPVESIYKEAMNDKRPSKTSHPKALQTISSEILGTKKSSATQTTDIAGKLMLFLQFLQRRFGISESTSIFVLLMVIIATVPTVGLMTLAAITNSNRRKIMKDLSDRYGNDYS